MPRIAAPSHFTQLRDWSERKHAVLEDYLPAFCRALSRHTGDGPIWYVDGYAGAGIYGDPDNPNDLGAIGSPILAARKTQGLSYPIRCLNVEGNTQNFESLQRETAAFTHVENIHADFTAVVDDVLAKTAGAPAFFFLDSFGTKELPMDGVIDRIALRMSPTDVLLRYATDAVRRLAGAYEKGDKSSSAHARNLDKWFRGQEWRTIIAGHSGPARDEALLNYYIQQLVTISKGRMKMACSYPIRTSGGITKYHLVFATGNRLGIKIMSDILYKADTKYEEDFAAYQKQKEREKRGGQTTIFDIFEDTVGEPSHSDAAARITKVKQAILKEGHGGKRQWEFDDLRYALMMNGLFAQFSEKDFRDACKELHAESRIERISEGRGWTRGTLFTLRSE